MKYLLCIHNQDYKASLDLFKVYRSIPDPEAEENGFVRIIDNSGEDYLFPMKYFAHVELSAEAERAFATA
jgi:hypothetical protein